MDLILKPVVVETPKILQNQQIHVHTKPTVTKVRIGEVETLEPDEQAYVKSTQYSDETVLDIGIPKGFIGAKIVDVKFIDENETGTIYEFLFDDGQRVEIVSPRGPKGDKGGTFDLGEEEGTAYEGSKGKANADAIFSNTMDINDILKEQSEQNSQIESNKKEVHNIKQALLQNEVLVVSKIPNKTTTRITAGGKNIVDDQYTAVTEIKGKTVRNENLIPYPYKTQSGVGSEPYNVFDGSGKYVMHGITFKNDNGVITANGTSTYEIWFRISPLIPVNSALKYYVSGCPSGGAVTTKYNICVNLRDEAIAETGNSYDIGSGVTFTPNDKIKYAYIYILVHKGTTLNDVVFKPLFVQAETGIWTPPFSDLKHAYINSIKSTGRNLFDKNDKDIKDGWFQANGVPNGSTEYNQKCSGWIAVEPNTTYIQNFTNVNNQYAFYDKNKNWISTASYSGLSGENHIFTFTTTADTYFVRIMYFQDKADVTYLMLGTEEQAYEPYTEELYQLPETLELGEWDSFNPQTGEIVRQTRRITIDNNLGGWDTLETNTGNEYSVYIADIPLDNYAKQAVCNFYKSKGRESLWQSSDSGVAASKNYLRFKDPNYTDLASFRAYAQSLANAGTPMIVDIKVAPTIEKIENSPKLYKAWKHGSETIIQGETDNSIYGAMPTITNEYILKIGGEE